MLSAIAETTTITNNVHGSKNFNLDLKSFLANYELKIIENSKTTLKKYMGIFDLFQMNLDNYQDLIQHIESVELNYQQLDENTARNLNRFLVNYLSSTKMFLEHTEAKVKSTFGKESKEFISWKTTTAQEYDTYFAYRFLYQLRNFTQHIGLAIATLNLSASSDSLGKKQKLELFFSKNQLLDNSFDWKKIYDDLVSQPEKFSVLEILLQYNQCMDRVYNHALELLIVPEIENLITYLDFLKNKDIKNTPYLLQIKNEKDRFRPQNWKGLIQLPVNNCINCLNDLIKRNLITLGETDN